MKTLIDVACVNALKEQGNTVVYVDDNTLLTPAARDAINNAGMTIQEGTCPACTTPAAPAAAWNNVSAAQAADCNTPVNSTANNTTAACTTEACTTAANNTTTDNNINCDSVNSDLIFKVLAKLQEKGLLSELLNACSDDGKPYCAECDEAGFKLIHGNTVQMEMLDTGDPSQNGKVNYQEIIGVDDGSNLGCGFITIDDVNFDWLTECQEVYYIVSGVITVTIDGKVYEAHAGDSFFIKKGVKCAFGAKGLGKAFYATF